jgi:dTMP kinase
VHYAVAHHDHPYPHLDLFLERPGEPEEQEALATWRIPGTDLDALRWPGVEEALPHHRRRYLSYEGPVSGGRGQVHLLDTGSARLRAWSQEGEGCEVVVELAGQALRGVLTVLRRAGDRWRSHWRPPGGLFVALEGIDGSGKSQALRAVAEELERRGRRVWVTCEPTGAGYGAALRQRLEGATGDPLALTLGFAADRAEHLWDEDGIMAHRARGEVVLCDRYRLSSLAYQCEHGVEEALVTRLNACFPDADLTVLLDLPVEQALGRLTQAPGRGAELFERRAFLEGVRRRYLALIGDLGGRGLTLDAAAPPEVVAGALLGLAAGDDGTGRMTTDPAGERRGTPAGPENRPGRG